MSALTPSQKSKKRRDRLHAAGMCVECGYLRPKAGRKRCVACLADAVDRATRYQRARRERAAAAGGAA